MSDTTTKIFHLPDLGEGLAEAEIREWYVKVGDEVKVDQPIASVETAKAVVDVPSPYTGKIAKLFGKAGDIIPTDSPFVEFEVAGTEVAATSAAAKDTGTVVGEMETGGGVLKESFTVGGSASAAGSVSAVKATPAVRALASKLKVDLAQIKATSASGMLTTEDVLHYYEQHTATTPQSQKTAATTTTATVNHAAQTRLSNATPLRGTRRVMALTMQQAHASVVPVTILDDADIHHWPQDADITVKLIRALVTACQKEPALNAWFDGEALARQLHDKVNLGLAVDSEEGLLVPVMHDVAAKTDAELRKLIETLKIQVSKREVPAEDFKGATITLSNFGKFAGRYANPIIVPPMVAIVGIGKLRDSVVAVKGQVAIHRTLPISVSFDHRAVTGGEATRFLGYFIQALES